MMLIIILSITYVVLGIAVGKVMRNTLFDKRVMKELQERNQEAHDYPVTRGAWNNLSELDKLKKARDNVKDQSLDGELFFLAFWSGVLFPLVLSVLALVAGGSKIVSIMPKVISTSKTDRKIAEMEKLADEKLQLDAAKKVLRKAGVKFE